MKHFFLTVLLTFSLGGGIILAQTGDGDKVTVNARLKGLPAGEVVYYAPQKSWGTHRDSTISVAGGFSFSYNIPEGDVISFQIGKKDIDRSLAGTDTYRGIGLYLEPGEINIVGEGPYFKKATFSGSPFAEDKADMDKYTEEYSRPLIAKMVKRRKNDLPEMDEYGLKQKYKIEALKKWIINHPASGTAMAMLEALSDTEGIRADSVKLLFNKMSLEAKKNAPSRRIEMKYEINNPGSPSKTAVNVLNVGEMAKDFTQPDTAGKPVSLKDFRGKYVLVDFWASWCGPCRAENPNVVKAYGIYKDRGFTVLSVSLDKPGKKEDWINAIHEDGLTWTHVADLLPYNKAAELYGVRTIPTNYLIDPQGKIVGKNLRGADLQQKLAELIK